MNKATLIFLISITLFATVLYFSRDLQVDKLTADSKIIIKFDKPIKRQEVLQSISPNILGEWSFKDPLVRNHLFRTLVFTPAVDFKPNTDYKIQLDNVAEAFGMGGIGSFTFDFKTKAAMSETVLEPEATLIDIPLDWQDYPLSCEAASLKMALSAKDVHVSEDEILEEIGYDPSPHVGDFWGNPQKAFVGDVNGEICETGYGVYWQPLAEAANLWREAEAFSNWTLEQTLQEIQKGNPVVFWGVLPKEKLTDCSWRSDGKRIKAFKETHVRTVIGFIGSVENPSKIIINDPLSGRLYWDTSDFLSNWSVFNNSGVVVR